MSKHHEIYIGTGEKCGFYTLHSVRYEPYINQDGFQDTYIKNLSTDWDTAFEKAQAYADRVGAFLYADPFELDEFGKLKGEQRWQFILKYTDPQVVPFGKYKGYRLSQMLDEDVWARVSLESDRGDTFKERTSYLWWMVNAICKNPADTKVDQIPFKVAAAITLDEAGIEDPAVTREREIAERKARDAEITANAEPVPAEGRHTFTGEVLTVREQEGYYGWEYKILFRDDRGFKLWGSKPKGHGIKSGDRIQFDAAVSQSEDDDKFGFFKRPTKVSVLEVAA